MAVIEHVLRVRDLGSDVVKQFKDEVSDAVKESGALGETLAGIGGAAIGAGTAFATLVKQVADFKNEVVDAATATGLQAETLAGLDLAARGSGQSLGSLSAALRPFSKRLLDASNGTGEALRGFKALGIETNELDGSLRSADDVLREATAKLAAIEDPTTKAALATSLFGEAGANLVVALGDAPLDDFIADAERLGPSFEDGAAGAADLQRAIAELEVASIGAADAFAQAFDGEEGLAGLIRTAATEITILTGALGAFFQGVLADFDAVYGRYDETFGEAFRVFSDQGALSGPDAGANLSRGLGALSGAPGAIFNATTTFFDPTRAVDVVEDVQLRRRQSEQDAFLQLSLDAADELVKVEEDFQLDVTDLTSQGADKRTAEREREAKEAARIARQQRREQLQIQREIEALAAGEFARRDAAGVAAFAVGLDQAATIQAQAAATAAASARLGAALNAPPSAFGRFQGRLAGASALESELTAQFASGLPGVDASTEIDAAVTLERFNAGLELAQAGLAPLALAADSAVQGLRSLALGDAEGALAGILEGFGAAANQKIDQAAAVAGTVIATVGGPYGAVIGAAVSAVGDKIGDKFEGIAQSFADTVRTLTVAGSLGVGGIQENLNAFQRDFFAGMEVLPIVLEEVLPEFIDSFSDQFAESAPVFAETMTELLIANGPDIGAAIAKGMIEGARGAITGSVTGAAFGTADRLSGAGLLGAGNLLRDTFDGDFAESRRFFGGGLQRGTEGLFSGGVGDALSELGRTGALGGGGGRRVVEVRGPELIRDLVDKINEATGDRGALLQFQGQ